MAGRRILIKFLFGFGGGGDGMGFYPFFCAQLSPPLVVCVCSFFFFVALLFWLLLLDHFHSARLLTDITGNMVKTSYHYADCLATMNITFRAPRSGLAWKHSIDVGSGVVDADYRGPVGVILVNH